MSATRKPEIGTFYFSPINALGAKLPDIDIPELGVRISNHAVKEHDNKIWPFMGVRASEGNISWEHLHGRMEMYLTGLAIVSYTHCWISDYIYDEQAQEVWRNPGAIRLITEKEGDPLSEEQLGQDETASLVEVAFHVARQYPRVFLYHHIGLLLLRTPIVGYNLNAEILLNLFKVSELVTSVRTHRKPTLARIVETTSALGITIEDDEVKKFWQVRSRDAAHDFAQAENVERELAVDCKLWAEELVVRDWLERSGRVIRRTGAS